MDEYFAARTFDSVAGLTLGGLERLGGLGGNRPARHGGHGLLDNGAARFQLVHAHHVPGHGVALGIGRDGEVKARVDAVRFGPAGINSRARATQDRTGGSVAPGQFHIHLADAFAATAQDHVVCHQIAVHGQPRAQQLNEIQAAFGEVFGHVVVDAAEGEVGVGQPRAGDGLQDIKQEFPVVKGVHDGGKGPKVQEVGSPPKQVGADTVQFRNRHPDVLGAFGHFNAGQAFH